MLILEESMDTAEDEYSTFLESVGDMDEEVQGFIEALMCYQEHSGRPDGDINAQIQSLHRYDVCDIILEL